MANTIQDKLAYLEETKGLIKQSIIAKGVDVSDTDTFRSYANKIEAIQTGGGSTVNLPDGTKFSYSTFTTIPDSIIPYLETQTDMNNMFAYCGSLQTVPQLDTSMVDNMSYMFSACVSLQTVPQLDTSRVTNMSSMFSSCIKLTSVPQLDTSMVNNMSNTFNRCFSLTSVPQFSTSSVNYMISTFYYCEALKTVPLLNVSSVNDMRNIFSYCSSLTNLGGFTGLKENLNLAYSPLLTVDSVMNVINNAADMTTSYPTTLTLHKGVFNKLSKEQIAIASKKGWNIAAG